MADLKFIVYPFNEWKNKGIEEKSISYKHIEKYLTEINTQTVLEEKEYVDKDFLIDYSSFYSRVFSPYLRFCKRYHFFSMPFDESSFKQKLTSNSVTEDIKNSYLGFVIEKPIEHNIIGRSFLKEEPGNNKIFHTLVNEEVNLFGVKLKIASLRYQEQDSAVCACATVAIWSTIQKLKELFDISGDLSPFEITQKANMSFPSTGRTFPSHGLNRYQISAFFKSLSLEVEYIKFEKLPSGHAEFNRAENIKSILYAYLMFGIPIIGILALRKNDNEPPNQHAVSIVGFEKTTSGAYTGNRANNIVKLYVHDDRVGPFSEVNFIDNDPCKWECAWNKEYKEVVLTEIIIPLYHKIRLSFDKIYNLLAEKPFVADVISSEILLINSSDYKTYLLKSTLNNDEKLEMLSDNMPRFCWLIRGCDKVNNQCDILYDATDTRLTPWKIVSPYQIHT